MDQVQLKIKVVINSMEVQYGTSKVYLIWKKKAFIMISGKSVAQVSTFCKESETAFVLHIGIQYNQAFISGLCESLS